MDAARHAGDYAGNRRTLSHVSDLVFQRIHAYGVDTFSVGFAGLVVLAALNRETNALLIVLAWFAFFPRRWRAGLLYAALAAATYGALRLAIGDTPNVFTTAYVLESNLAGWRVQGAIVYGIMLLPLFLALVVGWRRADRLLRRLALVVLLPYMALFLALGAWQEVRLLMPVLILLLPMLARR
jgi:hypothetical protein